MRSHPFNPEISSIKMEQTFADFRFDLLFIDDHSLRSAHRVVRTVVSKALQQRNHDT